MKQFLPTDAEQQHAKQARTAADLAHSENASSFVDNRPMALAQRKLREAIDTNPKMLAQRKLAAALNNSPRMVVQRELNVFMNDSTKQLQAVQREELLQGKFKVTQLLSKVHTISSPPVQREVWSTGALDGKQTNVNWATDNLGGDTVGTEMLAKPLGPEHLQGGPPKSGAQNKLMNMLPTDPGLTNPDKYIRGHLLNDNLGGPGEPYNLFPITANANKEHETSLKAKSNNG